MTDIADRACCPIDLPAISAIISAAATIGSKITIRPKAKDDWTVAPNLWGMGVLPPGYLKSHCLEEPKKPLDRLEIDARKKHEEDLKEHSVRKAIADAQDEAAKSALKSAARRGKDGLAVSDDVLRRLAVESSERPAITLPTMRRKTVGDVTVEKLGELLIENPNGLLVYRDELMGFFCNLEKQGHEVDRAFFLEGWNGIGSFLYDRIGRGSLYIPTNTISILGGIQPGRLASYIRRSGSGDNDDGLISRFQLAVYPDIDRPYVHVDRYPEVEAKQIAYNAFLALDSLTPASISADHDDRFPFVRFANDAQEFFTGWFVELENRLRSSQEIGCFVSHLAKYRSLMPSLALLFHMIEWVGGRQDIQSNRVSLHSAAQAAAWCDYLEQHARRIYQMAFDGDPEPAQRLAERIKSSLPNPFAPYQVAKKGWAGLSTVDEVDRAVAMLEDHGWVYRNEIPSGPQGGRPKIEIHVNPRLLEGGKP